MLLSESTAGTSLNAICRTASSRIGNQRSTGSAFTWCASLGVPSAGSNSCLLTVCLQQGAAETLGMQRLLFLSAAM